MKKILMFLFILSLPLVNSSDTEIYPSCGGDNQLILGCLGDEELSFFGSDLINPEISIIYPTNNLIITDVVTGSFGLNVNFSVNDVNLHSCWYRLSGVQNISNTSISCLNGYNTFLITITSFGDLTLDVFTKDFSNNGNSSQVNFSISEYTGPQTGGGSTTDPSIRETADFNRYNRTIMCEKVNDFLELRNNYTLDQKEILKNNLAIIFSFAISDYILDEYLENFEENCPEYLEPGEPDVEDKKNICFWIVLVIILLMIMITTFILKNKNKTISLNKGSIKKLIENLQKMIQ